MIQTNMSSPPPYIYNKSNIDPYYHEDTTIKDINPTPKAGFKKMRDLAHPKLESDEAYHGYMNVA